MGMSESLTLDDVIRRFVESERALTAAAEQIGRLGRTEERAAEAARAIDGATDVIRSFAASAGEAATTLSDAQAQARLVLEAGGKVLDGSELRGMHDAIDQIRETTNTVAASTSAVLARLEALEGRAADAEAPRARAELLERQLAHIRANVSDRQLRKALESMPQQ